MLGSMQSIRAAQLGAFEQMLRSVGEAGSPWKVMVYDKFSRDIVTVLAAAKKSLWRDHNVTLKMLIESPRERISDVAAIYFVQPTQENLSIIARDTANGLYDSIHIHFSSPCSKESLEWLAKEVAKQGGSVAIAKVWDQYLGFLSLEKNLFSLNFPGSFVSYNAANVKDETVIFALESFAAGLTNALVSFGRIPIIRCERGGPAKELADLVTQRISQIMKDRSMFQLEQTSVEPRPMMLILDRGSDMATPLFHSDIYQCLVDDLLGAIRLNRLEFVSDDGKKRACELDSDSDSFWAKYGGAPIPQAIDAQMEGVRDVDDQARRMGGGSASAALNDGEDNSHLMDAVNALPELTERKRILALHGSIMGACFSEIKKRTVTKFHEVETRMTQGKLASRNEKKNVLELLADVTRDPLDRLRLLLIHVFTAKLSVQEIEEFERVLLGAVEPGRAHDEVRQALIFAKRVLSVATSFSAQTASASSSSSKTAASAFFFSTVDSAFSQFQERLQTVAHSVTGSATWGPAARAVDVVCGGSTMGTNLGAANPLADVSAEIDSQYLYLDPKVGTSPVPPTGARFRGPFQRCFVFVVGGGCYAEYHNLQQYGSQRKREIIYGATEMLNPSEFLKQMRDSA